MTPRNWSIGEGEEGWALCGGAVGFAGGLIVTQVLLPGHLELIIPATLITAAADAIAAACVFRMVRRDHSARWERAAAATLLGGGVALAAGVLIGSAVGLILAFTICPGDGQAIFFVPILALMGGMIGGLLGLPVGAAVGLAGKD